MPSPDPLTPEREAELSKFLLDGYFKGQWFQARDRHEQRKALHDHLRGRYDICRMWLIPWLQSFVDLRDVDVVEIGCGTGSTSAALAVEARSVEAYDIVAGSVDIASRRAAIMGCSNARFHHHAPERIVEELAAAHPPGTVAMVVCFAVLEHATHQERLSLLRLMWEMLEPGGLMVIGGTPNRLSYWDFHTSWLHFFDSLPHEIAVEYARRSPRKGFAESMDLARRKSREAAEEKLVRAGRGVSYHEFDLAIPDISRWIVGDGFDPEPMSYHGVSLETRVLYSYAKAKGLDVHPAFLRSTIEVVVRKPGGPDAKPPRSRDLDRIVRPFCRPDQWWLDVASGHEATLFYQADSADVLRVSFGSLPQQETWRVQLMTRPAKLTAGAEHVVRFRMRADKPRSVTYALKQRQRPWGNVGLMGSAAAATDWQTVTQAFRPTVEGADAVFAFELGGSDVAVEIADVSLLPAVNGESA